MKVSPINSNNRKSTTYTTIFKAWKRGDAYKIKRAVLKEAESKAVYEKASNLLNKLPSGKMESTSLCNIAGKQFGIRWNTKDNDKLMLKVKDKIETNKTDEWNEVKDDQTVLECLFNSDGIIYKGNLTKRLKNGYSINAFFQRDNDNRKTIIMDGITYRQYPGNEDYWTSMPSLSCYNTRKDINLKDMINEAELAELFCELIKKNTTIK